MKGSGETVKEKVMEYLKIVMERFMKDSGKMV